MLVRDLHAFEKRERELDLERAQREMKLKAMEAETELANLRDQNLLKMQEMKLQIEEAEGSCSAISPSLMSLSIDEDKDSDIKSWLDENSVVMNIQNQISQNDMKTEKRDTAISSDAVASRSRGKPLKKVERKDLPTER